MRRYILLIFAILSLFSISHNVSAQQPTSTPSLQEGVKHTLYLNSSDPTRDYRFVQQDEDMFITVDTSQFLGLYLSTFPEADQCNTGGNGGLIDNVKLSRIFFVPHYSPDYFGVPAGSEIHTALHFEASFPGTTQVRFQIDHVTPEYLNLSDYNEAFEEADFPDGEPFKSFLIDGKPVDIIIAQVQTSNGTMLQAVSIRTKDRHICNEVSYDSRLDVDQFGTNVLSQVQDRGKYLEIKYVGNNQYHIALKTVGHYLLSIERVSPNDLKSVNPPK